MRALIDARPIRVPVSGVARYCIGLLNAAARSPAKYETSALVQGEEGEGTPLDELHSGVARHRTKHLGRGRKVQNIILEFVPSASRLVVSGKWDLQHETYFADMGSRSKSRKVCTIHDVIPVDVPEYVNRTNRIFSRRNLKRQIAIADQIICVSRFTRDRVLDLGNIDPERVSVIGCGVDPVGPNQRPWVGLSAGDPDKRFVLMLGNVEPRKNLATLAMAVAQLQKSYPGLGLKVAGKANFQAMRLIEEAQATLPSLEYLGMVSEAEKWSLIRRCSVMAIPSLYEGYGIPVIEGYRVGAPTIFSNSTSLAELALDPRQTFDPLSPTEIAACISRALDREYWWDDVQASGLQFAGENTWADVWARTQAAYDLALSR